MSGAHADEQESLADLIRKHQMTPYADGKGGWLFRAASAQEIAERVTESEWLRGRLEAAWDAGYSAGESDRDDIDTDNPHRRHPALGRLTLPGSPS